MLLFKSSIQIQHLLRNYHMIKSFQSETVSYEMLWNYSLQYPKKEKIILPVILACTFHTSCYLNSILTDL